jgi:hypothetical protein
MVRGRRREFNAPTRGAWIVAVILGLVAVLLHYRVVASPALGRYDFLLMTAAFVLLVVATVARGI